MMRNNKLSLVLLLSVVGILTGVGIVHSKTETKDVTVATTVKKEITVEVKDLVNKTDLKLGFIDQFGSMRVSKEGEEAATKLEQKRIELAKGIEAEAKKVEVAMNELKTKAATMNDSARLKKNQEIEKMKRDYESTLQGSEEEMKLVMQQVTEVLAKEVDQAVIEVAKKDGLDAVIDKMTGRVIYASDKCDYTSKVVQSMDKHYSYKIAHNEKSAAGTLTLASNPKKSANA